MVTGFNDFYGQFWQSGDRDNSVMQRSRTPPEYHPVYAAVGKDWAVDGNYSR